MNDALSDQLSRYHAGTEDQCYRFLGCHPESREGTPGFVFRVWAPNARSVRVVGDFNFWNGDDLPMEKDAGGIWQAWSPHPQVGQAYKYLVCHRDGRQVFKMDPVGRQTTPAPDTSSVIRGEDPYSWHDSLWMARQARRAPLNGPMNIYEMHLGSWRRAEDGGYLGYRDLAQQLPGYLKDMGYTHVEFMPLGEYPFDPSWGYQVTGYFAPTSRYGAPEDLKFLIDQLHQAGIGVILDWVAAHFPKDEYGLYEFDGTCTYEYADPMMNEHAEWTTRIFDWGRPEVRSFLISNAVYWLREFHIDGLRVDAVSSMIYLDYARPNYRPNRYGGRENLEAIDFLRQLNRACFAVRKGIVTAAEESTAFPLVTRPDYDGGLGFLLKWNMGWMNDTLRYFREDPLYRKYRHDKLTFSMTYAFSENYILPLSHDEVVHMKGSLLDKMPGEYFWKFAGARLLRGYQIAHPGKKLCFMGAEIGQFNEWNYAKDLDWSVLEYEMHQKLQLYYKELNRFYRDNAPLWAEDFSWQGYQWIAPDQADHSVLAFRRIDPKKDRELICVLNFTPVCWEDYRLGLPREGTYDPVFCSDEERFGGTGQLPHPVISENIPFREYSRSGLFRISPMSLTFYARRSTRGRKKALPPVERTYAQSAPHLNI